MRRTFDSRLTMFVYLKGHALLRFYLAIAESRDAANDGYDNSRRLPEGVVSTANPPPRASR